MIRFIDSYFSVEDGRGSITGLVNFGEWREINLIRSAAGIVRGGHYHQSTLEGFVILQGKVLVAIQEVRDGRLFGEKITYEVAKDSVFIIEPMVCHEFLVKEPSVWINFLSVAMDPASPDIHRI